MNRFAPLLVPIDTPAEALAVVRGAGWDAGCADVREQGADVGAVYAVTASKTVGTKETVISGCSYVDETLATVLVTADGFLLQHDTRGSMRSTACASIAHSEKAQPRMP